MNLLVMITLYILSSNTQINAELYSAISKMESLLKTQKSVINSITHVIKTTDASDKLLKKHLQVFETEHQRAMEDIPKYIGNPVNCFKLIKRLTADFEFITKLIQKTILTVNESVMFPTKKDLEGAAEGLLRVESAYGITKTQLASGMWNASYNKDKKTTTERVTPMTLSDCNALGKALFNVKSYADSIQWLEEAKRKYRNEGEDSIKNYDAITEEDIETNIDICYDCIEDEVQYLIEMIDESLSARQKRNELDDSVMEIQFETSGLTAEALQTVIKYGSTRVNITFENLSEIDSDLCKGDTKNRANSTFLFCYWARGPDPFLYLAPYKAEQLHYSPALTLFYDVMNDEDINRLKSTAMPRLQRSKVGNRQNLTKLRVTKRRVSQGALVQDPDINDSYVRRVSQFSGLKITGIEPFSVENYGIGGFYIHHYDSVKSKIPSGLDRRATVLFFMSNVEQGGATVFHKLGVTVFPVKGAALFWFNTLPFGDLDLRTLHSACPVLQGSKWIATLWINEYLKF